MNGSNEVLRRLGGGTVITKHVLRNRYCVDVELPDGKLGSCYCSSPIYTNNGKPIDCNIHLSGSSFSWQCSSAQASVTGCRIRLTSGDGSVSCAIGNAPFRIESGHLISECASIIPTVGGVQFSIKRGIGDINLEINVEGVHTLNRSTTKYIAAMIDDFRPLFILSAIGIKHADGSLRPFELCGKITENNIYTVCAVGNENVGCIGACGKSPCECEYVFELSMYEQRLFLDTTVDIKHSGENNVYGAIAYIGNTPELGTQWLYTRPSAVIALNPAAPIRGASVSVPILYRRGEIPEVYRLSEHFCSIGTTWDGRLNGAERMPITVKNDCLLIDIYDQFVDSSCGNYRCFDGILLRTPKNSQSLCVIPTGDNTAHPWMLCLKY